MDCNYFAKTGVLPLEDRNKAKISAVITGVIQSIYWVGADKSCSG